MSDKIGPARMTNRYGFRMALYAMAAAAGLCTAAPARANLVSNGDFETGSLTGWSASGNVTVTSIPFFGFSDPAYQHYFAVFNPGNSSPNGVISQTIATVAGVAYTLAFDYGDNGSGQSITASVTDSMSNLLGSDFVSSSSPTPTLFTLNFTADSTSTIISFVDFYGNSTVGQDGGIDNVSVTQVPEPVSLALLGLAATATLTTRRRKVL